MQRAEDDVRDALPALYLKLRRFAFTLTGTEDGADDLVQITCERAIRQACQRDPATPLVAWLYSVMNNAWEGERELPPSTEFVSEVPEHDYRSTMVFEDRLMLRSVRRKILDLPEEQRSVVTLVGLEGFSYKETAEMLGIRIGTVMSRLFRGRHALSRMIDMPSRRSVAGQDL
jgi:RNA polymerase sigma-70 factor (ECF subfamily)